MEKSRNKFILPKIIVCSIICCVILFLVGLFVALIKLNKESSVENEINTNEQVKNVLINQQLENVQVPNIMGLTLEEAKAELEQNNLKVEIIEENHEKIEKGYVFTQIPEYNTIVEEGSTVKLYVSIGI